jgi:nucleoside-diphosphate-sugar epimerase
MVKPGKAVTVIKLLGDTGAGHHWSYIPDVARTMVLLLENRDSMEPCTAFHMAGHWDSDGTKMAQAIINAVVWSGGAQPKVKKFPWWLVSLASPLNETFREMSEMRYMWKKPIRTSNERLIAVLGHEPHTPLKIAVHATLEGMGCLKPAR